MEHNIWLSTIRQGVFGVFECTLGWFGKERVDYMTMDTKGIWRCYEIKVSKSDFNSKAKISFVGNYNYYVMPQDLYEQVKDKIPKHVGVWIDGNTCIKRARKQNLQIDVDTLKDSMIRSLCRDVNKIIESNDTYLIDKYKREINRLHRECSDFRSKYYKL